MCLPFLMMDFLIFLGLLLWPTFYIADSYQVPRKHILSDCLGDHYKCFSMRSIVGNTIYSTAHEQLNTLVRESRE